MVKILIIDEKEMRAIVEMYGIECVESVDTEPQGDLVKKIQRRLSYDS